MVCSCLKNKFDNKNEEIREDFYVKIATKMTKAVCRASTRTEMNRLVRILFLSVLNSNFHRPNQNRLNERTKESFLSNFEKFDDEKF